MTGTGVATRLMARRAVRRMLGRHARLTDETVDGSLVFVFGKDRLVLRTTGSDPHLRLLVNCPTCGRPLIARSVKIRDPEDLDDALLALELASPACPTCPPD